MAITRAQQVRQMLIKGGMANPDGRLGFFKGAQKDASEGKGSMSPGTSGGGGSREGGYGRDQGNPGDQQGDLNTYTYDRSKDTGPNRFELAKQNAKNEPPPKKPKESKFNKFKRAVTTYTPLRYFDKLSNSKLARINNAMQRQKYIDSLDLDDVDDKEEYDRIMNQLGGLGMDIIAGPTDLESTMLSVPPSMLATDPMTQFKKVDGVSTLGNPGVDDVLGTGYDEYLNRFDTKDQDGPDNQDPCKGPNPPAYCFIGNKADETQEDDQDSTGGLAFRFMNRGGMPMDAPTTGGIMDLETGRQMYFLGKLVKKATRAVKKITKSPLGKIALGAAAFKFGPAIFGKGSFNPLKALITTGPQAGKIGGSGLGNLLARFGLAKEGALTTKGMFGLGGGLLALLPFLSDEEKQQLEMDRGVSINPGYIRDNPYTFRSRVGDGTGLMTRAFQDGGDVEPVAKKTMPLLDMDGKEMDFREDGGFVPIGRMERADDVPARLSKNEFVFTADAVRNAGDGDIDKGAEVMYNMMKNLESGGDVSEESQGLQGAREMFQTSKRLEEVL